MKKILTKTQKEKETLKFLKQELKGDILKVLTRKLQAALASGGIPEYFMQKDNHLLSKAIIDSFCRDRPYSMLDTIHEKDSKNLHLFI